MICMGLQPWREDEDTIGIDVEGDLHEPRGEDDLSSVRGSFDPFVLHVRALVEDPSSGLELRSSGVEEWLLEPDRGRDEAERLTAPAAAGAPADDDVVAVPW